MSRSILITGGGRGIGRAVALRFAEEKWSVAVVARTASDLEETLEAIEARGGRGFAARADVSVEAEARSAVERTVEQQGGIDVLVNNAGIFRTAPLLETSAELFDSVLSVNLTGVFHVTRAVARHMVDRGRGGTIVNISSVAGKRGYPGSAAYCASKFGLLGFTEAIRLELRPHRIRVQAVCPGQVDTAAWDHCGLDLEALGIDRGRMMKAEDVAALIAVPILQGGTAFPEDLLILPEDGE